MTQPAASISFRLGAATTSGLPDATRRGSLSNQRAEASQVTTRLAIAFLLPTQPQSRLPPIPVQDPQGAQGDPAAGPALARVNLDRHDSGVAHLERPAALVVALRFDQLHCLGQNTRRARRRPGAGNRVPAAHRSATRSGRRS